MKTTLMHKRATAQPRLTLIAHCPITQQNELNPIRCNCFLDCSLLSIKLQSAKTASCFLLAVWLSPPDTKMGMIWNGFSVLGKSANSCKRRVTPGWIQIPSGNVLHKLLSRILAQILQIRVRPIWPYRYRYCHTDIQQTDTDTDTCF